MRWYELNTGGAEKLFEHHFVCSVSRLTGGHDEKDMDLQHEWIRFAERRR